jgi:hypothetical protein
MQMADIKTERRNSLDLFQLSPILSQVENQDKIKAMIERNDDDPDHAFNIEIPVATKLTDLASA